MKNTQNNPRYSPPRIFHAHSQKPSRKTTSVSHYQLETMTASKNSKGNPPKNFLHPLHARSMCFKLNRCQTENSPRPNTSGAQLTRCRTHLVPNSSNSGLIRCRTNARPSVSGAKLIWSPTHPKINSSGAELIRCRTHPVPDSSCPTRPVLNSSGHEFIQCVTHPVPNSSDP